MSQFDHESEDQSPACNELVRELKVMPKRDWATPEQVKQVLESVLEDSVKYRWISVSILAENSEGQVYTRSSRIDDKFSVGGQFLLMALKALGFVERGDD